MSDDRYEYTLCQARLVHVRQSEATEEFLSARRSVYWDAWRDYKQLCQARHEWGIYLRSNYDWDWDVASCLECLFELPEEAVPPAAAIATIHLDVVEADTWNLSTAKASLPTKMRVAYKSPTGDTRYKTFVSCLSSEDIVSAGELELIIEVQDKTLITILEPRGERKEADDRHGTYNAAPMPETESELGVKQGVEKRKEVPLIPEKPHSGAVEEELNAVVDEGGCDTLLEQETEEGVKGNGDGGDCSSENGFEELMIDFEATQEQYTDEISICSLD